jgi:hypothetical protein
LDSTCSDAAAAVKIEENGKASAISAMNYEIAAANNGTLFQRLRVHFPGKGKWKKTTKKRFAMKYMKHLLILLIVKHISRFLKHSEWKRGTEKYVVVKRKYYTYSLQGQT